MPHEKVLFYNTACRDVEVGYPVKGLPVIDRQVIRFFFFFFKTFLSGNNLLSDFGRSNSFSRGAQATGSHSVGVRVVAEAPAACSGLIYTLKHQDTCCLFSLPGLFV